MQTRSKGIILSYLKVAVNMLSGLVLSSALLRLLGDTEYGIYQTIAAFANYLILLEFGVGTVMTRNISLCRGRMASEAEIQRQISTIWTLTCMLSLVVLAVSVGFFVMIPKLYAQSMTPAQIAHGQQIFVLIIGQLFCNFLMHSVNAVILSYENYSYGALQSITRTIARTVLLVVLLLWWKNGIVIAAVDLLLGIGCLLCSLFLCRKKLKVRLRFGQCDWGILASAAPLAVAVFLQGLVSQANNNVDKFLIGMMLSPESVALYSVALYIYSIFSSLMNVPASMYIPSITQKVGQGLKGRELAQELVPPGRLTALVGGMLLFGFAAVGRQFVCVLYGEKYLIAWPLGVLLMAPAYLDTVLAVLVNVLDAMNKRLARSLMLICTTVLNVVLTVVWLPKWGIGGATAATALCTMIGPVILMGIYYKVRIRIPILWLYARTFRGILLYLVVGCGAGLLVGRILGEGLVSLLAGGVCFVAVALGGFALFGADSEEKSLIRSFISKLRKKTK